MNAHEPQIEDSKPGMILVWALGMAAVWGIALYWWFR